LIDYGLHFFGGLILFVIFAFRLESVKGGFVITMYSALLWEAAQLDVYWHEFNYKLSALLGYNWLNNGLDIVAALGGIALALFIMWIIKRLIWY
jgi:hypothetical protein